MGKGTALGIDMLIAASMIFLCLTITIKLFDTHAGNTTQNLKSLEKEIFASTLSEATVKTRSDENPAIGAAFRSNEKKRIEANVIDEKLLQEIRTQQFGNFRITEVYEKKNTGEKTFYLKETGIGCITSERFVVIKGILSRKGIIGVTVCES